MYLREGFGEEREFKVDESIMRSCGAIIGWRSYRIERG